MTNQTRLWWQTAVIYQIYPRSFQDTTGNGVGDLPGITSRLDYLAETLGVDAIWISPFYPSPMADFGYDVADYCDVHPMFGTLDDFDELLAAAHDRGLRVIIDWVPNHTSDRHPWFVASRSSRTDPKRDWYVWRDAKPDGSPPNNWQSNFGGRAWTWDEGTGQYYLHSFLAEQPDLNWRNPEVQAAMFDTVRFWMDRGVDGIRIDVAHYIMKDPELRDNPPALERIEGDRDRGEYDELDHVHDKGHPDVHAVFRDLRRVLDDYPGDRFSIGEINISDWNEWAAYYGENLDGLHMPYNFSLLWAPWSASVFRSQIDAMEAAIPQGAWPNLVLGNHDEVRLGTRYGPHRIRIAAMLLLTVRGTPTMYYGDEIGMPETEVPPEQGQDPWGIRVPGQSRDGCRTPMQWTADSGVGFSDADVAPWIPYGPEPAIHNVMDQAADRSSILNLYRSLLALRRTEPALHAGIYHALDTPDGIYAYQRQADGVRFLVALNFTSEERSLPLTEPGSIELSTGLDRIGSVGESLALQPDEGVIIRLQ
jgi:glycosidase